MDATIIVIMLTGEKDIEIAKHALDIGAIEYITKPFDLDYLRSTVNRLLKKTTKDYRKDSGLPWRMANLPKDAPQEG